MIKFYDGFVINPDILWRPSYRISPYQTSFTAFNKKIVDRAVIDTDLLRHFFGEQYFPVTNGRTAIGVALRNFKLEPDDEVAIFTTSGNHYISSCVTNEIDKICKWSRKITEKTKLLFVNHEFGYCYRSIGELKKYNLPIIEDRAMSFVSTDADHLTGNTGDFVIYSLPKFFPVSFGGVLKCNNKSRLNHLPEKNNALTHYFSCLMSYYLKEVVAISEKRLENYRYLEQRFIELGFKPFFELSAGEVPGVFMFCSKNINLTELKKFMQLNGIESSVFYGEEAFFIPVHQGLTKGDIDFFYTLIQYFSENGNQ